MDFKKFERAKEIEKMDGAMTEIKDYISRGRICISTNPYVLNEKIKSIEVPETVVNVIYNALCEYQEELEKEFEEL